MLYQLSYASPTAVSQLPILEATTVKCLFSFRGPRRQAFVAGVEVKGTLLIASKGT